MKAYERLINYVKIYTTSDEITGKTPSAAREFDLARLLVDELHALGIDNAAVDDKCYVYASLDATPGCENLPKIGFIAHMDTAPDFSGENVKPCIINNYDGKDVALGNSGRVLKTADFPELAGFAGRTLITTDGTTLLGADDKAGIAEITTMLEHFVSSGEKHGKISVCFTPDEEIGEGADHFDIARFGADFAYTLDGGEEGEVVSENFNAASAVFTVNGNNIHPGDAKGKMINAALVATEIVSMLPAAERPEYTEGHEGFYHLTHIAGNVEKAMASYIVRDHSSSMFEARLATVRLIEKRLNEKYGNGTVNLEIKEQYRNMLDIINGCRHIVDSADEATRMAGLEPIHVPIRGGTDGARLSYMGLPCPNLGTGGFGFHGPYEHISAEGMDKAVEIIENIVRIYVKQN